MASAAWMETYRALPCAIVLRSPSSSRVGATGSTGAELVQHCIIVLLLRVQSMHAAITCALYSVSTHLRTFFARLPCAGIVHPRHDLHACRSREGEKRCE